MITRPSLLRLLSVLASAFALFAHSRGHAQFLPKTESYQGTEAILLTPWPIFNRSLESLASPRKSFQEKAQNVIWNVGPLHLSVSSVEVAGETGFDSATPALQQLALATKDLALTVTVENVAIDQVIDYPIGGATLHVHIQTDCGPFTLTQTAAKAAALIAYQFQDADVTTQMRTFDLQWAPQTWSVSNFGCRGPTDLPETVRREITTRLQNAEAARPFVEQTLNNRMQALASQAVQAARFPRLLPAENGLQPITVEFSDSAVTDKALLSHGQFTWEANDNANSAVAKMPPRRRKLSIGGLPKAFAPDQVSLVLPEKGVSDLLNAQLRAQPKIAVFDLQQQAQFKDIWSHPLKIAFGWPDLANYSVSSPFELDLQRPDNLDFVWDRDGSVSTAFPVQGVVRSTRDNRRWDYIPVRAQTSAKASTSLVEGKLSIAITPVVRGLQASYGAEYVTTYHPNPKIPIDLVQNFLNTSLKNLAYAATIPALDLREAGVARASALRPDGAGLIIIPFDITLPSRKVSP